MAGINEYCFQLKADTIYNKKSMLKDNYNNKQYLFSADYKSKLLSVSVNKTKIKRS